MYAVQRYNILDTLELLTASSSANDTMANFLAAYDPHRQRRIEYTKKCKEQIIIFDELEYNELFTERITILWAANKTVPLDSYQNENQAAVLFGDAIRPGSQERLTAQKIMQEWHTSEEAQKHFYDGYYCSVLYDSSTGITIGGDILGLFPIYYYSDGEITLAASSPELFRYHESFKPELCIKGLTGMLMTMHSVEELTLWKNVYRLSPGHLLHVDANYRLTTPPQFHIPTSNKYFGLPFSQQCTLINETLVETFRRHVPENNQYAMLFSGGLDSRIFAGYLKQRTSSIKAITMGIASDIDMKTAKSAGEYLDFEHEFIELSYRNYKKFAELTSKWEHNLNGFNSIQMWGLQSILSDYPNRILTGYVGDSVLGGSHNSWAFDPESGSQGFDTFFRELNKFGIEVDKLTNLLKKYHAKDEINNLKTSLGTTYSKYSAWEFQRAWAFDLHHRQRFHIGGNLWKLSFGSWPIVPILDSKLLSVMGGMPAGTIGERLAQKSILRTFFPNLARIPLDTNSNQREALLPTWQFQLKQTIKNSPLLNNHLFNAFKYRFIGSWKKNLYYYRVFDLNNKGWKNVRRQVEPMRELSLDIFDEQKLLELLPPPSKEIPGKIGDLSGTKSLLGFLLWLQNH